VDGTTGDRLGGGGVVVVVGAPRNAKLRRKLVAAGWGKAVPYRKVFLLPAVVVKAAAAVAVVAARAIAVAIVAYSAVVFFAVARTVCEQCQILRCSVLWRALAMTKLRGCCSVGLPDL
jgi:hypothetical protein